MMLNSIWSEQWRPQAPACAKLIEEEGTDQFLVNLLYVLRECFQGESTR
jgi:hypothetical protein